MQKHDINHFVFGYRLSYSTQRDRATWLESNQSSHIITLPACSQHGTNFHTVVQASCCCSLRLDWWCGCVSGAPGAAASHSGPAQRSTVTGISTIGVCTWEEMSLRSITDQQRSWLQLSAPCSRPTGAPLTTCDTRCTSILTRYSCTSASRIPTLSFVHYLFLCRSLSVAGTLHLDLFVLCISSFVDGKGTILNYSLVVNASGG